MNDTGQSRFNQARIEWAIRLKYSPMPHLDMEIISRQLNDARIGELRVVGKTWEMMMEADVELAANADKRYTDAANLEWQIVSDNSPDGDLHAAALQYLYHNLTATEALDQDNAGGVDHLVKQVMTAMSYRYSVHEMLLRVDNPAAKEITYEFRHTPVWFMEARRGYLGYLQHIFDMYGVPCISGEWLTAVGAGWMRPLSRAYVMKQFPLRDWLIFCSRYGSGFLEAVTEAQVGSVEWNQAMEALMALSNDGTVLHNDGVKFNFLESAAKQSLPFHPLVEYVDRCYAKAYRGMDMATSSRASGAGAPGGGNGGGGKAVGASVQSEESGIYLKGDARWLNGVFQRRIDRPAIQYLFNQEPRAKFQLVFSDNEDASSYITGLTAFVTMGGRASEREAADRLGIGEPEDGEPILQAPGGGAPPTPGDGGDGLQPEETPPGGKAKTLPPKAQSPPPKAPAADPSEPPVLPVYQSQIKKKKKPVAADQPTTPAKDADQPIAPGAQPGANQIASPAMPDTQVDAAGFWSRAGLAPKGADGQTLPMPSLGYALPNSADSAALREFASAVGDDLEPVLKQLFAISQISDDDIFQKRLAAFLKKFPSLSKDVTRDPASGHVLLEQLHGALIAGMKTSAALGNADPYHDEKGRFTYASAIGKKGGWKDLGLPHAQAMKTDPLEPEADPNEARDRLKNGFEVNDYSGKKLKFGQRVLDHWGEAAKPLAESDRRLRRLNDAIKTAQAPREVFRQGTGDTSQTAYVRASEDEGGKRRYHFGFLADKDGNVHTFFHSDRAGTANSIREGTLIHGRD